MKKIAIFVEGQAEQLFSAALINALANAAHLQIQWAYQFEGKLVLKAVDAVEGLTHFVMLVDCRNDEQVKTQIRDNYASLVTAGYSSIIGLRDVYPFPPSAIPSLQAALGVGLPLGVIPIRIHLAVMELESWFIAEDSHFSRISPTLTSEFMAENGFDVSQVPAEQWAPAAEVLDAIYSLAGLRYRKTARHVKRTIRALSIPRVFSEVRLIVPELNNFVCSLEDALGFPKPLVM